MSGILFYIFASREPLSTLTVRDAPLDFKGGEQEVWVRTSFFFLQPGKESFLFSVPNGESFFF